MICRGGYAPEASLREGGGPPNGGGRIVKLARACQAAYRRNSLCKRVFYARNPARREKPSPMRRAHTFFAKRKCAKIRQREPLSMGRLRAPPGADTASNKEWPQHGDWRVHLCAMTEPMLQQLFPFGIPSTADQRVGDPLESSAGGSNYIVGTSAPNGSALGVSPTVHKRALDFARTLRLRFLAFPLRGEGGTRSVTDEGKSRTT